LNGRYKKKGPFENYEKLKNNLPLKLLDVKTKGKLLYLIFNNNLFLVIRFGLVGGWCYLKNNSNNYDYTDIYKDYKKYGDKERMDTYMKNSLKHLNFEIVTNEGKLYYYDILSYGTLKCIDEVVELNNLLNTLGPDIMDISTTLEVFKNQILKKNNLKKAIGNVIVNQKIISGLGNYLRADILWLSKINPFREVKDVSNTEFELIFNNCKILTWGIYNETKAYKLKILNKNTKLPSYYNRLFFIYMQENDIYGNKVVKKELYDGGQKRFISYVPCIQI
jgi:formamidopyrimidine-DNA glycosylase